MGRYNGSFKYKQLQKAQRDPVTGMYQKPGESDWQDGCECQIEYSIPGAQKIGADGQMTAYTYDVFIPKHFTGELEIGSHLLLTDETGKEYELTALGVDNLNRKYTEVWG